MTLDLRARHGLKGSFLSYFTRHGTAANLLLVAMMAFGLYAASQIRSQFLPDIVIDTVTTDVRWDGAGPEEVDDAIVGLLEPTLLAVEGVTESTSRATEGWASIVLEFEPGWDMARAAEDVRSAVDAVTDLPTDAEEPEVRRGVWRDRVTDVVIQGPVSADQLGRYADEFVARLFRAGVARTTVRGAPTGEIIVEVPEAALIRNKVTLEEVAQAIREEATTDPAGDVASGSARIRAGIEKRTSQEIRNIVIRSEPGGRKLRVGDVADLRVEIGETGRRYFVGDERAISIRVDRADLGDAIALQTVVQEVADQMQVTLPENVEIRLIRTRAQSITDRLNILLDNGLMGLGLVLCLLFLFLNARTAFWVAAGIPVAMFAAIGFMYVAGLTINMVSLFGLIICLGIVVDDAIVVGEHADFRSRRLGEVPVLASENAARRMAAPVISATATTIIAFYGLTLVGGRFGSLIVDIPWTVIMVLMASLAECFLILPHHMSHALAAKAKNHWYDRPSQWFNFWFSRFRQGPFRRIMALVIRFRYPVVAFCLLLLSSQVALFLKGDIQWRFFNAPERGSISGNFAMLPGADREDTTAMMRELQRSVAETGAAFEAEYGTNPVDFVLGEVGGTTGRGLTGEETKDEDHLGSIAIELIDADLRPYTSFDFLERLQKNTNRHALLETLSFRGWRSGPGGDALDVQFFGASADVLKAAAEDLKASVAIYPEVSAIEDTLAYDKQDLVLELTPQGRALGFSIDAIGRELRNRLSGIEAATFPTGVRTTEITVQLPESEVQADFLTHMRMRTPAGTYVPLADVVDVSSELGFSSVRRENGLRVVSVSGDIAQEDAQRAAEISERLKAEILPRIAADYGVDWRLSGLAEQEQEFLNDALVGYSLCLLGIYLALAWIFSSWSRPLLVMAIIPFGFVGTLYGHYQWGVPLSIFSVVGIIGMSGIIINDSIVLVTSVDVYAEDRALIPSIIDATADRFRPVLLTTLTTVLGLTPLMYESSQQAQFLKPTVITLVFGLGFGLFLVLLVVPALLAIERDVGRMFTGLKRASLPRRERQAIWSLLLPVGVSGMLLLMVTMGPQLFGYAPLAPVRWLSNGLGLGPAIGGFLALIVGLVGIYLVALMMFLRRNQNQQ